MSEYPTECAALLAALSRDVESVTFRDRKVDYAKWTTEEILARMQVLGCGNIGTSWQSRGVNPCTSKGFGSCDPEGSE